MAGWFGSSGAQAEGEAMRVYLESLLDRDPDKTWAEVQRSALLLEVCRPLVRIVPVSSPTFPEQWQEGVTVRCKSYLLGFLPLGTRNLLIERIDPGAREIQSRESDPLVRRWDHLIRVRPAEGGHTLYSDEIEIEAGLLTPLVWLFAQLLYRHRQRKWRRGTAPGAGAPGAPRRRDTAGQDRPGADSSWLRAGFASCNSAGASLGWY
jgi:hypothetical protein